MIAAATATAKNGSAGGKHDMKGVYQPGGSPSTRPDKRGAGAGCMTPFVSTNVQRAALWGGAGASATARIGATQAPAPSSTAHHSFRARVRNPSVRRTPGAGSAVEQK